MSFSKQYFDNELTDLTSQDLIKFFESKQIESIHLEFKQYNPRANQDLFYFILPGITAFLNSEGGLLIFGAPKPTQENKKEFYQGELTPFPPDFIPDKDTIIRKISDNIRSMPLGIKFHLVEFDSGLVAVFEVPQSQIKPHQFNDRYLVRLDGQNKPAPHYLIEALFKQVKMADIRSFIKVTKCQYLGFNNDTLLFEFNLHLINFTEFQNEKNVRFRLIVDGEMELILDSGHLKSKSKSTEYFKIENLPFGEPYTTTFSLTGGLGNISKDKTVLLNIIFHGESCPSKLTVYKFPIKSIAHRGHLEGNKAKLDINNILISEHQRTLGLTHEESLKQSLGIDL